MPNRRRHSKALLPEELSENPSTGIRLNEVVLMLIAVIVIWMFLHALIVVCLLGYFGYSHLVHLQVPFGLNSCPIGHKFPTPSSPVESLFSRFSCILNLRTAKHFFIWLIVSSWIQAVLMRIDQTYDEKKNDVHKSRNTISHKVKARNPRPRVKFPERRLSNNRYTFPSFTDYADLAYIGSKYDIGIWADESLMLPKVNPCCAAEDQSTIEDLRCDVQEKGSCVKNVSSDDSSPPSRRSIIGRILENVEDLNDWEDLEDTVYTEEPTRLKY